MRLLFRSRVIIYSLCFFLSLLVVSISWKPAVTKLADWSLQAYCLYCLKATFAAKEVLFQDGHVVFKEPHFQGGQKSPLIKGQAEELRVKIEFLNAQPYLFFEVSLQAPRLEIRPSAHKLETILHRLSKKSSSFQPGGSLLIRNGLLVFDDPKYERPIFLKIEGSGDQREGSFALISENNGSLTTSYEGLEWSLDFNDFSLCDAHRALLVCSKTLPAFCIRQGLLDGELSMEFDEDEFPNLFGQLDLSECSFESMAGDIHGYIPSASLRLADSSLAGDLSFSKGTYLEYTQEGKPPIALSQLEAKLSLPSYDRCFLKIGGLCAHHNEVSQLSIEGHLKVPRQDTGSCEMEMVLDHPERGAIKACLRSQRESYGHSQCALDVHNVGAEEWDLLMQTLGTHEIGLEPYSLKNGTIDAHIILGLEYFKIRKVNIETFDAKDLIVNLDQSDTSFKIDHAHGNISLDLFAPNILDSINSSCTIDGGMVHFPGLGQSKWPLSHLETKLVVENGCVKKSIVEATFMGLKGVIEVDFAQKKVLALNFEGKADELLGAAPKKIRSQIAEQFKNDKISLLADVHKNPQGFSVDGLIKIHSRENNSSQAIQMGFLLDKSTPSGLFLKPSSGLQGRCLGSFLIDSLFKRLGNRVHEPAVEWLQEELKIAGLSLKNGWFTASNLQADKYVGPILFSDGQLSLSGKMDLQGRFDYDGLALDYKADQLFLENEDLVFEMKDVGAAEPAKHYFDFTKDIDSGTLGFSNGTYFEKTSGLLFTGVEGVMALKDKIIQLSRLKASCNEVSFAGSINLDYSSPLKRVLDVKIGIEEMEGDFTNVCGLLSHFNQKINRVDIPLNGKISLLSPGFLSLGFSPCGCTVDASLRGRLTDGFLDFKLSNIDVKDIGFEFDYNHLEDRLNLHKFAATLNAHSPNENALTYDLKNGHVHFLDLGHGFAEFDLPIFAAEQEIAHLAGSTEAMPHYTRDGLVRVLINKERSHCAGIPPEKFNIVLDQECEVDSFELEFRSDFSNDLGGLQQLGIRAISSYAPHFAKRLQKKGLSLKDLKVCVGYENENKQLDFFLEGKDFRVGEFHAKQFVLAGAKKRHLWSIEQLKLDHIGIAADLLPQEGGCIVNFLGVSYGDMLLMGLDGSYNFKEMAFDGRVNLLELDFAKLGQWKSFRELVHDFHPEGKMKSTGSIRAIFGNQWPPYLETHLKSSLRGCTLRDLHFEDADDVACEFVLGKKLLLYECSSGLKCGHTGQTQGVFGVDWALYDFGKEELTLSGLHFDAHAANLNWVASHLEKVFPEAITPAIGSIIRHIKDEDVFRGTLDIKISDTASQISMRLPQGKYRLGTKEHEINHFKLEWDKKNLEIVTQYRFQNTLYWATILSASQEIESGDIFVSGFHPEHPLHLDPSESLHISWYMHPQYGMIVESAKGHLPGISLNLKRDRFYPMNPHSCHLDGSIVLDPKKGFHVLPPDLVQALESWNICRDYHLDGKWIFMTDPQNEGEVYFKGNLQANEAIVKGYLIDRINAELDCSPNQINIKNLTFHDFCGQLSIKEAKMTKNNDNSWWVFAPNIEGKLFRPSALRNMDCPTGPLKPLIITHFEVNDIICKADDLSTMTGHGKLTFSNSSKKPLHNPILAIPTEIISRIGLNLDVLSPVSGTMFFDVEDSKVFLTKFKDVYSEGKLSKFYLPNNSYASYVGLNGEVYVQVRMKQYNLLFKLAELFTVSVHGSLQKLVYTLQKH